MKTAWEDALPNGTAGAAGTESAKERETAANWDLFHSIIKKDAAGAPQQAEVQPSLSDRLNKVAWEQSLLERAADGQPQPQMSALAASAQQTRAEQQQAEWTLLKKMVRDHPDPNPNPNPKP